MINPAPPDLNGLHWCRITSDDLPALVALAVICQQADGGLAFLNKPDNLSERYFPNPAVTGLGAWDEAGQLVAGNIIHGGETPDRPLTMVGQVAPDWRHRGLGRYLIRWGLAAAVSGPSGPTRLQIRTESLTEPARRLYENAGFGPLMEELVMRRDLSQPLPEHPLPSGLELRSWRPELAEQLGFVAAGRRARFERRLA